MLTQKRAHTSNLYGRRARGLTLYTYFEASSGVKYRNTVGHTLCRLELWSTDYPSNTVQGGAPSQQVDYEDPKLRHYESRGGSNEGAPCREGPK